MGELLAVAGILIAGLATVGVVGLVVVSYVRKAFATRQAWERSWRELAECNGLTLELQHTLAVNREPAPSSGAPVKFGVAKSDRITGTYRGRPIEILVYNITASDQATDPSVGRPVTQYTAISITVDTPSDAAFALQECNRASVLGKRAHAEKVQTGDENFDRRFSTCGRPQTFATRVLTSAKLRDDLLRTGQTIEIALEGKTLVFVQKGILTDVAYLQFIVDLVSDLAEAVEQARWSWLLPQ